MRLARLDLMRYGRFTDASIELPRAQRDIHIVFGPNEAGKTTSLTAIEDMLFGIPERSPYNFLHSYEAMRVGGVLENEGDCFEFLRRKTRRDMILGADGDPLPGDERLLAPFLGGADRVYFDRMFNLSHSRLAEGGKAIIEAKDDVGQMLFAAGTGLADLRERLKVLEGEADQLWAPRKSKKLYYQAQARWEEGQTRQREHSLSVSAWRTARKTLSDADQTLQKRREEHEETSKELKKLVRIRRVHGAIRRKHELKQEIEALGDVIVLAENAAVQLNKAEQQEARIRAQADILAPQFEEVQQSLEAISFDEMLVKRADEIEALNEQRIEVRSGREDLPKRRDEFHLELKSLAQLAAEIGWGFEEASELIERIPSRSAVERVRSLLVRHGELAVELRSARKALEESQVALQGKIERLEEIGEATDVSGLAAVLRAVRDTGDVAGRIRTAQGQAADVSEEIEKRLRSMEPALPAGTDIEELAVPPREAVIGHRDDVRNWAQRQGETKRQLTEARNHLEGDQKALERRVQDEGIVGPGAVKEAREYRDTLWDLVKTRYVACSEIPAEEAQTHSEALEDLPASLEGAVEQADNIADRRFEKAQAAGELAVLGHNIAGHETRIGQLEADEVALNAEGEQLDQAWLELWADTPIEVLGPDVMLEWLEAREDVVTLIERRLDVRRQVRDSKREEQEAIAQVCEALTKVGRDAEEIDASELRVLVERADAYRREQEAKTEKTVEMREAVRAARSELSRRQRELEDTEAERKNWQADWSEAVAAVELECDDKPDVVSAQIKVIDEMRDHASAARDLRDRRITTIERDIENFERAAAAVTAELASDLTNGDADASVEALDGRREEALKLRDQHRELTQAVAEQRTTIEKLEEDRRAGWTLVQPLLEVSGVETVRELSEAIERSDQLRTLNEQLARVMETLDQQGDGLAIEVIEEECRGVDIDQVRAREEAAEAELKELAKQLEEAIVARTEARKVFEAIGGDDTAARAAADCEEALAAMQDAAERYVWVRASAMLLRWAVDRYRKEKQGPLLRRAGELFRVLTLNSFERLEVRIDQRDTLHLTGVRPDGEVVPVPGLSSGTEDQLFLALRIAAVEDYLARAVALPFVADDLFINFDPERSAAGFEVLGQLAEQTQVLFYTHHPHLVDVARETLGVDVHVATLADAPYRINS